jgi:hypothetical protein
LRICVRLKTEEQLLWQIEELKKQLSKQEANDKTLIMAQEDKNAELRKWLDEAVANNIKLSWEKQQAESDVHAANQRLDAMSKAEADLRHYFSKVFLSQPFYSKYHSADFSEFSAECA